MEMLWFYGDRSGCLRRFGCSAVRHCICQAQLISSFENNLSSSVGATWEGPGIPNSEFVSDRRDRWHVRALRDPSFATGWNIQAILKGGLPLAQASGHS